MHHPPGAVSSNVPPMVPEAPGKYSVPFYRQESFFHYLFGVEEEDYIGILNIDNGETILLMPRLPASYAVWMGEIQVIRLSLAWNSLLSWRGPFVYLETAEAITPCPRKRKRYQQICIKVSLSFKAS